MVNYHKYVNESNKRTSRTSRAKVGRIPVINKHGSLALGFKSGSIIGHGVVIDVSSTSKEVAFEDGGRGDIEPTPYQIDMVIMATGYKKDDPLVPKEDRSNDMFLCGFGDP